jgi:hypothetical protein
MEYRSLSDKITLPLVGVSSPPQHMQQGTFSGAGFSDNGDKFSLLNLNIHMIDGFDLIFPRPIKFAKLIRF